MYAFDAYTQERLSEYLRTKGYGAVERARIVRDYKRFTHHEECRREDLRTAAMGERARVVVTLAPITLPQPVVEVRPLITVECEDVTASDYGLYAAAPYAPACATAIGDGCYRTRKARRYE